LLGVLRPSLKKRASGRSTFAVWSIDFGVGQPDNCAIPGSATVAFDPSGRTPVGLASFAAWEPVALLTVGAGQPASIAKSFKFEPCRSSGSARLACTPLEASAAVAVGQFASQATRPNSALSGTFRHSSPSFQSRVVVVVGHPIRPVASLGAADARSRENRRPEGVAFSFQVSRNKVDPQPCSWAFNLLPKDDVRSTLADEPVEGGP
jgi:hypothetical protein